jgi:hypothetical protein
MRAAAAIFASAVLLGAMPAGAQDRFIASVNIGQQATSTTVSEERTFQQYLEEGSLTFGRTIPKALFVDAGLSVHLWRGVRAGASVSIFEDSGLGELTANVPHPLFFDQRRTVTGTIGGVRRREVGQHFSAGWMIPNIPRIRKTPKPSKIPTKRPVDFIIFGGPSIFTTDQIFVTTLRSVSLANEIYPFDTVEFPGAVTEKTRNNVVGYHAGLDITWRLKGRFRDRAGVGLLVRYASGKADLTPTGGRPVEIEVGGFHAGGGLRLIF